MLDFLVSLDAEALSALLKDVLAERARRGRLISLDLAEFSSAEFWRCSFKGATLLNCDFAGARFVSCEMEDTHWHDTGFAGASFLGCDFYASFLGCDFYDVKPFDFLPVLKDGDSYALA
jgi:uncharacterized protein YjbI with pentapeptide repeats